MMGKKSYELYPQEKPRKKNKKSTLITRKLQKEIKALSALSALSDDEIDFSDIAELNFDKLGKPIIGKFYRPIKKPISIRMDSDVLEWFKAHSHYQRLINKACRLYMYQHLKK
jgi:uncharacterized protein (DUF4415 family)